MKSAKQSRETHGGAGNGKRTPQQSQQQRHPEAAGASGPTGALQPGTEAPDFNLLSTPDQRVDLNHFRGRPVVLVFYPADWSPVCGDQLALYNEILPEFNQHNAQ